MSTASEGGAQIFFLIRKFLDLFRYRKSSVRKPQIMQIFIINMQIANPQFPQNTAQVCISPEICLLKQFCIVEKFEFEHYAMRGLGAGGPLPTEG
jgi:hypothetical protein